MQASSREHNAMERVIGLLDVHDVPWTGVAFALCDRIRLLTGYAPRGCLISCPPVSGQRGRRRLHHYYSIGDGGLRVVDEPQVAFKDFLVMEVGPKHFGQFDDRRSTAPAVAIVFESTARPPVRLVTAFVREFINKVVHRQRALIRRAFVEARAQSGDLGTFLHRLMIDGNLRELVGFESGSVFVTNREQTILRLRKSTGLKRAVSVSEISFSVDDRDGLKVPACYRTRRSRVEFSRKGLLREGYSAETTQRGTYARLYWPIQLQEDIVGSNARKQAKPILGVIRVTNHHTGRRIPFNWMNVTALAFVSEAMYNIVVGFTETEDASFKRDESFHSATIIIDSIQKNISMVTRLLFDDALAPLDPPIDREFELVPLSPASEDISVIRQLLRTSYASAMDINFQVERSNIDSPHGSVETTERLYTDVLLRAIETLPFMLLTHNVSEKCILPQAARVFRETPYPPPVKGSPGALFSVFVNLLDNAVKYRRPDKPLRILISVEVTGKYVDVSIRDFGIGVESSDLDRLCLRYYRSERAKRFVTRGSGIGLNWCERVLAADEGELIITRMNVGLKVTARMRIADGR